MALQALIVTAVVVLLAAAAGVVLVAVTRSASDDLAGANPSIEGNCNKVEIYDLELAAAGIKGSNQGHEGSDIGCVPVCVIAWEQAASSDGTYPNDIMLTTDAPIAPLVGETRRYDTETADPTGQRLLDAFELVTIDPDGDTYPVRGVTRITWRPKAGGGSAYELEVTGPLLQLELLGRAFLMKDETSVFTAGGSLRFNPSVDHDSPYKAAGLRVNTKQDDCEWFDVRGEKIDDA